MQIVEVKNNLVRVQYNASEQNLLLSGFAVIKDKSQSFIGQIIHLEAIAGKNTAILKLLFTFNNEGVITNYNGAIPNLQSVVEIIDSQELLSLLPIQNPIFLGEVAQQKIQLNLDIELFEENLLVCCEKEQDKEILSYNFANQLALNNKKVLVLDLIGNLDFSQNKICSGKDFKLPLNYETINFIYEKGIDNASSETKALIQDVFLEVQNYVKTLPEKFIPFETFKNVVDSQYEEMELIELLLLKNRLLKYYDEGIFAQEKNDFESLRQLLKKEFLTVIDLSKTDEKLQREVISYIYSLLNELGDKFYVILNIDDENSDKKLLKQIFTTKNVYSTMICQYSYKYLRELKQLSKNLILFAPVQQQNDFAGYNIFLNKLNQGEFIVYGKATHHIPLIVKLEKIQSKFSNKPLNENIESRVEIPVESAPIVKTNISQEELELDEQINRDVDEIYTATKQESAQEDDFDVELIPDDLTDEDLDFIEEVVDVYSPEELLDPTSSQEAVLEQEEIIQNEIQDVDEIVEPEKIYEELEQEDADLQKSSDELIQQEESFSQVLENQALEQEELPQVIDILPANAASTPIVPIYSADVEPVVQSDEIEQGDIITHPKYGKGTVEKLISYGSKTLCSINFDNVGRRLLDPNLAEIKKVSN